MAAVRFPWVTAPATCDWASAVLERVGVVAQPFVGLDGLARRDHQIRRRVAHGVPEHQTLVAFLTLGEVAAGRLRPEFWTVTPVQVQNVALRHRVGGRQAGSPTTG